MPENTPFALTVSGTSEIPLLAERAIINVAVSSDGLDKAKVSNDIISAARQIESMLRELSPDDDTPAVKAAAPLAHWSKTSLSATSYVPPSKHNWSNAAHFGAPLHPTMITNDDDEEPARRYRGNIKFDIRFKDFKALGSFGTKISSIEHVEVSNITWSLTDATEAKYRTQLRRDAAKDALTKARDYCDVLGCVKLRPVELHDNQSYHMPHMRQGRALQMQSAMAAADPGQEQMEELEFTPQEIKMTMEISIKFHADSVV